MACNLPKVGIYRLDNHVVETYCQVCYMMKGCDTYHAFTGSQRLPVDDGFEKPDLVLTRTGRRLRRYGGANKFTWLFKNPKNRLAPPFIEPVHLTCEVIDAVDRVKYKNQHRAYPELNRRTSDDLCAFADKIEGGS